MAGETTVTRVAAGRECGACTLCCKLLAIEEIGKPKGEECPHCDPGVACRIYETRPGECRRYYCEYLLEDGLADYWYPKLSRIVLSFDRSRNRLNAYVETGRAEAWREDPFYADLRRWAAELAPRRGQVVVKIGARAVVILPDRHVDLGVIAEDEVIVTAEKTTAGGVVLDVLKMKLTDPRIADLVDSAVARPPGDAMGKQGP
jgi:hypothetical protein